MSDGAAVDSGDWAAFHIFFPGDLDQVLLEVVRPVLDETPAQAFFLRYWNGGPHLRLRISGGPPPAALHRRLERGVVELEALGDPLTGEEYAARTEALRAADRTAQSLAGYAVETPEPLQPTPSVQLRTYRFDARRFGGDAARPLVERHFHQSSMLAMKVVAATLGERGGRWSIALYLVAVAASVLSTMDEPVEPLLKRAAQGGALLDLATDPGASLEPTSDEARQVSLWVRGLGDLSDLAPALCRLLEYWRDSLAAQLEGLRELYDAGLADPDTSIGAVLLDLTHLTMNRLGLPVGVECRWYAVVADLVAGRR